MLRDFIAGHRDDIRARASLRVAQRNAPVATEEEVDAGAPRVCRSARRVLAPRVRAHGLDHSEIQRSAGEHSDALFHRGATVAQVVHDYGDLFQVITGLAVETSVPIATEEFQTLNLCLDDAIAGAVARFAVQQERAVSSEGTERLGVLAHEMRKSGGCGHDLVRQHQKGHRRPRAAAPPPFTIGA